MPVFTTQQIADKVGGRLDGPGDLPIAGVDDIGAAAPGTLTFIREAKYAKTWVASKASAALVGKGVEAAPLDGRAVIHVDDADLALAAALELFAPPIPRPPLGIHPTAITDPSAQIGQGVAIGPYCVIGARAKIGDGCVLHNHVTVMDDTTIGPRSELFANVVVRERCEIGGRCILHPGVVIGKE